MNFRSLTEWSTAIAEKFNVFEDREVVVFFDRDASLVAWAIRCLTNPRNEWAAEMLDMLRQRYDERKAELEAEQQTARPRPVFGDTQSARAIALADARAVLGEDFEYEEGTA